MSQGAWIKLSVGWDEDERIALLPYEAQLVWIKVLTRAKRQRPGGSFGSIEHLKALLPEKLHKQIKVLVDAGLLAVEDGRLAVVSWSKHQIDPTSSERTARWRATQSRRPAAVLSRTEIEREKEKEREKDTISKAGGMSSVGDVIFGRAK